MSYVKTGSPKQAKYAIRCIDAMCRSKDVIFKQLFEVRFPSCSYIYSSTVSSRQCDIDHDDAVILFGTLCNVTNLQNLTASKGISNFHCYSYSSVLLMADFQLQYRY